VEIKPVKLKSLLPIISLFTLLFSLAAVPQQGAGPTASLHIENNSNASSGAAIQVGDTLTYAADLQNLPAEGLTSVEFACRYDPALFEVSRLADAGLFGADATASANGPAGGTFVYTVTGVSQKASSAGTVFRFNVQALQAGSTLIDCRVRASSGGDLFNAAFSPSAIEINAVVEKGTLSGNVTASKPVTVTLMEGSMDESRSGGGIIAGVTTTNTAGTFSFSAPADGKTYFVTATAPGYLSALRTTFALTAGEVFTLPAIALLPGDVDNNNIIDVNDLLTIGINYNEATPAGADLNNDGSINVLDLQLLAPNFGKTGPMLWK
jgi:uncharacterized membrane protein YjjB (DUF3815 family)